MGAHSKYEVSVIVPVYNTEKYLAQCIESILAQTYTDFELLLIDDGSKDRSGIICDEYAERDSRIRVFHKENGGVSSARNLGLDNARGEWITFVDSDDTLDRAYLMSFIISLDESIDLYVQGYKIIEGSSETGKRVLNNNITLDAEQAYAILEDNDIINSPVCKLYKRAIISKFNIQFDNNLSYGEDHIFTLDYYRYCNHVKLGTYALYNYIHRPNESLTRRHVPLEKLTKYLTDFNNRVRKIPRLVSFIDNIRAINRRKYSILKRIVVESNTNSKELQPLWKYVYIRPYFGIKGLTFQQRAFICGFKFVPARLFQIISKIVLK